MNDRIFSIVDEILSEELTENFGKIRQGKMSRDEIVSDAELEQAIDHFCPAVEGYHERGERLSPSRCIYRRTRISKEHPWGPWTFVSSDS